MIYSRVDFFTDPSARGAVSTIAFAAHISALHHVGAMAAARRVPRWDDS